MLTRKRTLEEESLETDGVFSIESCSLSDYPFPSLAVSSTAKTSAELEPNHEPDNKNLTLPFKKKSRQIDMSSGDKFYDREEVDKDTLAYIQRIAHV